MVEQGQTLNTTEITDLRPFSQRLVALIPWPWELIPLVVGFVWLYRQTMPPGISSWIVTGWDSAMLQITGSTWGLPHSPGYPLYTIFSNLFVRLLGFIPGLMDTSVVWRVSFWSTTTSLLTLILAYFIVRKLTEDRVAALIAASILGVSFIFWRGAIMAEVYSLNALIFALTYWLALVWRQTPKQRWLIVLGLVIGAGVVHHRTAFILPPTMALWVLLTYVKPTWQNPFGEGRQAWLTAFRQVALLAGVALIPLLSYLYLPWVSRTQAGQTWLYADASDWNTFWFVVLTREWWGLVQIPDSGAAWVTALGTLLEQQFDQIRAVGVVFGLFGLLGMRRYLWMFAPPLLAFIFFGTSYQVADLDSMLIPLTLTLSIGVGYLLGNLSRILNDVLCYVIELYTETRDIPWLSNTIYTLFSIGLIALTYSMFRPLADRNYETVDLSGDWQAEDLVEEVVAISSAGTPIAIIGQDNSVLPDFIYAKVVLNQPVEALSTTGLSRLPEGESRQVVQTQFEMNRRVFVDIETLDLGFIPWLGQALENEELYLAPTGHPILWELLQRSDDGVLPAGEPLVTVPSEQFLEGRFIASVPHAGKRMLLFRT
ncbi:MAG: DUF2723 domain-containing protein [Chloroflexota bacterium]